MTDQKIGLTRRQREVYDFLIMHYKEFGYFPTTREILTGKINGKQVMTARTGTNSVHRMLTEMESKGWIRKRTGARALQIL